MKQGKKHDFPVRWMEAAEIQGKYHLQGTYGGILSKQGASIDAFRLAHDFLAFNHKNCQFMIKQILKKRLTADTA